MTQHIKTIYFIARTSAGNNEITVIDLDECVSYERSEFDCVNNIDFSNHIDAIEYAKGLANKFNFNYKPFNSRYDKALNEKLEYLL